jgi:hypothetical protein
MLSVLSHISILQPVKPGCYCIQLLFTEEGKTRDVSTFNQLENNLNDVNISVIYL